MGTARTRNTTATQRAWASSRSGYGGRSGRSDTPVRSVRYKYYKILQLKDACFVPCFYRALCDVASLSITCGI